MNLLSVSTVVYSTLLPMCLCMKTSLRNSGDKREQSRFQVMYTGIWNGEKNDTMGF